MTWWSCGDRMDGNETEKLKIRVTECKSEKVRKSKCAKKKRTNKSKHERMKARMDKNEIKQKQEQHYASKNK